MTLAHVSKVSEREYHLAKTLGNGVTNKMINDEHNKSGSLGPYARRLTARRATISEPSAILPEQRQISGTVLLRDNLKAVLSGNVSDMSHSLNGNISVTQPQAQHNIVNMETRPDSFANQQHHQDYLNYQPSYAQGNIENQLHSHLPRNTTGKGEDMHAERGGHSFEKSAECVSSIHERSAAGSTFPDNSHLNLNADERLFFECCNILKGADNPSRNNENNHQSVVGSSNIAKDQDQVVSSNALLQNSNSVNSNYHHLHHLHHLKQLHHLHHQHMQHLNSQTTPSLPEGGLTSLIHNNASSPKRIMIGENSRNHSPRLSSYSNNISNKTADHR